MELKPIGYKILLEVLARGKASRVKEVPYIFKQRAWGESKLDFREQINYLKHVLVLASKEREVRRFLHFCLVGLSGVGVNMGMFWLLTRVAGLYDLAALIFSIEISILSNFVLNDVWTFRDRRTGSVRATLRRALKFNLISLGAVALYYGVYMPLTRVLGIYDLLALLVATGIGLA